MHTRGRVFLVVSQPPRSGIWVVSLLFALCCVDSVPLWANPTTFSVAELWMHLSTRLPALNSAEKGTCCLLPLPLGRRSLACLPVPHVTITYCLSPSVFNVALLYAPIFLLLSTFTSRWRTCHFGLFISSSPSAVTFATLQELTLMTTR